MAKTAKPRASSNGEGKKTKSKSKSATKVKGTPSAWTQFRSRRTEELKKSDEEMGAAERLSTIQEEWKTSDENPKNQSSSSP
ncbi:hypothetical protein JCM5296_003919 [Sporobolomyces johnsonii]